MFKHFQIIRFFLSCPPDKQTNKQTDRLTHTQTDPDDRHTHTTTVGVGNKYCETSQLLADKASKKSSLLVVIGQATLTGLVQLRRLPPGRLSRRGTRV